MSDNCSWQGRKREYGTRLASRRRRLGTSAKCDGQWVRCECGATRNVSHLPITESEGSRRGQEFMSASEDTMPNLGEQKLGVVLDNGGETMIKYQIADVSRALNSITEICDAGHPDFGNHVTFGRRGGIVVNLETGKTTHFQRENNIYCLDYWVKPFQRLGS